MSFKDRVALFVLVTTIAAPVTAWSGGAGGPGCTNLPLYNRALGALQGMTSACDMSVEEARRIVAEHDRGAQPGAPPPTQQRPYRERAPRP